jgi:hypothetical protein
LLLGRQQETASDVTDKQCVRSVPHHSSASDFAVRVIAQWSMQGNRSAIAYPRKDVQCVPLFKNA